MTKVELLKRIYTVPGAALEYLHPDFTLYSPGNSPIAGTFHGKDEMLEHFADMERLSGGTFKHDVQEAFLADDKWGMVVNILEGERNGITLDMWGFGLWRFEDGLLRDHWESPADTAKWDEFWS